MKTPKQLIGSLSIDYNPSFILRTYLIYFLLLSNCNVFGQENKIDSILSLIKSYIPACAEPCLKDSSNVNNLCDIALLLRKTNTDTAIYYGKESYNLAENIGWQLGVARSCNLLGSLYKNKGEYSSSFTFYSKVLIALDLLEKDISENQQIAIKNKKSSVLNNIAVNYQELGDYQKALDYYNKSLVIGQKINDKKLIATAYNGIAGVYANQKKYDKALNYFRDALKIRTELGDENLIASTFVGIGVVNADQGNYTNALANYSKALLMNQKLGNKNEVATCLFNLGSVYKEQNAFTKALDYFFKALKIDEELDNKSGIARNLNSIGSIYTSTEKYTEAEKLLLKAVKIDITIGAYKPTLEVYQSLAELYEKMDNTKQFAYYSKMITEIKDTIFSTDKDKQFQLYEIDQAEAAVKAEQENKIVLANQKIIRQKNTIYGIIGGVAVLSLLTIFAFYSLMYKRIKEKAELNQKVSETEMKALRAQMNPHFIFNALNSIQTFLLSHQSDDANTYLVKFSTLMRLVLENSQHPEVPLNKDLEALDLYMQLESIRINPTFTYQFHIDKELDLEYTLIPPLILQPFVENAIWHGIHNKREPGHINITITKKESVLHCTVDDDGVGRDWSKKMKQQTSSKKESLGIKLTEERLKILNELKNIKAEFKIIDMFTKENTPAGTRVELSIPI